MDINMNKCGCRAADMRGYQSIWPPDLPYRSILRRFTEGRLAASRIVTRNRTSGGIQRAETVGVINHLEDVLQQVDVHLIRIGWRLRGGDVAVQHEILQQSRLAALTGVDSRDQRVVVEISGGDFRLDNVRFGEANSAFANCFVSFAGVLGKFDFDLRTEEIDAVETFDGIFRVGHVLVEDEGEARRISRNPYVVEFAVFFKLLIDVFLRHGVQQATDI